MPAWTTVRDRMDTELVTVWPEVPAPLRAGLNTHLFAMLAKTFEAHGGRWVARGAWAAGTDYVVDDLVTLDGSSYIAVADSTGEEPGTGASWTLIAAAGAPGAPGTPGVDGDDGAPGADGASFTWRGAWLSGATYAPNDTVSLAGASWVCILGHTNQTPPNGTYWSLMASKGDAGAPGTDGADGTDGLDGADGADGTLGLPVERAGMYHAAGRATFSATADTTSGSFAPAAGEWRAHQILRASDRTITEVGVRIGTAAAGSKVLIAMYEDNDGYPGTLVGSAEVDTSSTPPTARTASVSWARVKTKRYWLAAQVSNGAIRMHVAPASCWLSLGYSSASVTQPYIGWNQAGTYSATPPDPWTAGASALVPSSGLALVILYKT